MLPACLVFGLIVVFAFVKASQTYLSEYVNENSKEFIGKGLDLKSLAQQLQDERITQFAKDQENPTYILVFWSVNCAPCLKDLGNLIAPNTKSLIIPINTDDKKSLEHAHKLFSTFVKDQMPFLHDSNSYLQKQLKIKYLPTHVYLDKNGIITKHEVGAKAF